MVRFIQYLLLIFVLGCSQKPLTTSENNFDSINLLMSPTEAFLLPNNIKESSGLDYFENHFITVNDSGGEAEVYFVNEQGELVETMKINNQNNVDWEDITVFRDQIIVGEMGNNLGNRKNLRLISVANDMVVEYPFSFQNQTKYMYFIGQTPFDCESVFAMDESLWLLTKDWKNLSTTLYQVQQTEEDQDLKPLKTIWPNVLITGADYSSEKQLLVCSGYNNFKNYLLLFPNFSSHSLFESTAIKIQLKGLSNAQVEGVCFKNNEIYFSTEQTKVFQQQVWKLDLNEPAIQNLLK